MINDVSGCLIQKGSKYEKLSVCHQCGTFNKRWQKTNESFLESTKISNF